MRHRVTAILLLALVASLVGAPADARPRRDRATHRHRDPARHREFAPAPDREHGQLGRTRELLETARERLQGCEDADAGALLASAADMQSRAEQAGARGQQLAALQLTMDARTRVQRALERCHVTEDGRETARRTLQRTDAALERLRGAPRGGRAAALLDNAVGAQERARRAYDDGRLEESVQQSLTARAWALRAARLERRNR